MELPHRLSLPFPVTTALGALYLGDSLDALREMPDRSVDLVITSPPYDRQPKYGNGERYRTDWYHGAFLKITQEVYRILAPHGSFVLNYRSTLLEQAQRAARLHDGAHRRQSLALLSETYHLAQAFLAWHGDRELMWLCVDRGMAAALDADQPLTIARACWYAAHLLRAVGRGEEALARLREARTLVEQHAPEEPDSEWPAAHADLWLCSALTRARAADQGAWADWERAAEIVRQLPSDYVHPWTRVGRMLLEVYAVMCAVDLGDPEEAQRRARDLDPATIPSTERRARHWVELARGTDLEGSHEGTLHLLQRAANVSAETVAYSPMAQEMLGRLATDAPVTVRNEAQALAGRIVPQVGAAAEQRAGGVTRGRSTGTQRGVPGDPGAVPGLPLDPAGSMGRTMVPPRTRSRYRVESVT